MKHLKLLASLLAILALCAFTFTSCNLFDDEEEEEEESTPSFNSYFNFTITRCERVGSVLILDWKLTNKTKKDVQNLNLGTSESTDNLGNSYSGDWGFQGISIDGSSFSNYKTVPVLAGETITGKFRIPDFDGTNSAKTFTLNFQAECTELGLSKVTVTGKDLPITDDRVLSKGIQTNDTYLAYTFKSAKYSDGSVIVCFTVKNNTGKQLKNLNLQCQDGRDNLGNSYSGDWGSQDISLDSNNFISSYVTTDLDAGETLTYYNKIHKFSSSATYYNGSLKVSADNYYFEDYYVNFLNLPIN